MNASSDRQPSTIRASSRRALLAGALGGLGAWAASTIGRASPTRAANGDAVTVGGTFTGSSPTSITNSAGDGIVARNTSTAASGLFAYATATAGTTFGAFGRSDSDAGTGVEGFAAAAAGNTRGVYGMASSNSGTGVSGECSMGTGVRGGSTSGIGVEGESSSWWGVSGKSTSGLGVRAESSSQDGLFALSTSGNGINAFSNLAHAVTSQNYATDQATIIARSTGNNTGVYGYSGTSAVPSTKPKTGVYGYANQDAAAKGVWGFSGTGVGVYGQANKAGYALRTSGRIKADKVSGVATIPAGSTTVTLSPKNVNVTSSSFVLLTPKANLGSRGLWYSTNPTADSITIHISSTRSSNTKIAWLLLG